MTHFSLNAIIAWLIQPNSILYRRFSVKTQSTVDPICIHRMRHNTIRVTSPLVIFELQASDESDTPYVSRSDEKFIPSLWIQIEPLRFKVCGVRKRRRRATREFTKRAGRTCIYRLFLRRLARLTPDAHCPRASKEKTKKKTKLLFRGIVQFLCRRELILAKHETRVKRYNVDK